MASEERLRELEEKYEGYTVYDNQGSKIGKVDDLFVDEKDHEEYIGVKMGFLGRKSTLIPTEIVRVNESERTIEVSESKDLVKDAPSFDEDEDVTSEYEGRIRSHFGLESLQGRSGSGSYGTAAGGAAGYGASEQGGGREAGSLGYAPGDGAGESSDQDTRDEAYAGDRETSSETSSGSDPGYEERRGSGEPATGTGASGGSSGAGYYEQTGGSGSSGERHETSGSSGTTGTSEEGSLSSGSQPTTSRQTEETETFQEGGRTKVRRRVIREEVVDADDQGSGS